MSKSVKVKVRPGRLRRRQRREAKRLAKANEQMILCRQAGEFHKAYLEIEYGIEEAKLTQIQARLAALQVATPEVVVTEEVNQEVDVDSAPDIFDEMEALDD